MRKLKFRVWCKRTQEYHKPIDEEDYDADGENIWLQMCIDTNGRLYFIETSDEDAGFEYVTHDCEIIDSEEAEDFIIEQYTGLKDKNGKEIYEGDIVERKKWVSARECGYTWAEDHVQVRRAVVIFEHGSFYGHSATAGINSDYSWDELEADFEVIGNIHEKPELLEEKE